MSTYWLQFFILLFIFTFSYYYFIISFIIVVIVIIIYFILWVEDHSCGNSNAVFLALVQRRFLKNCSVACSQLALWVKIVFFCFVFLAGLFNIGNRLLVSIDLFLKVRACIKLGQNPSQVARTILDHIPNHPGKHWIQLCIHKFCNCVGILNIFIVVFFF